MSERKLVTIRKIKDLLPIPGADRIEIAQIDGWKVVAKKGEFAVGDPCVYFEIDSFLPESDARYSFLMKSGVREFEGQRGHRLRTVKLRGQISQGLALPLGTAENTAFPEIWQYLWDHNLDETRAYEADFSELLGIKKWEPQIAPELVGQVKGYFPGFITRTDQERCQNIVDEIFVENTNSRYEVSLKLDGTSVTYYYMHGEVGVCSRNLELKLNDANSNNTLIRMFEDSGIRAALEKLGCNVAIQGELMGPGIQNNREKLKAPRFFIFEAQNLDTHLLMTPQEREDLVVDMFDVGIDHELVGEAPVLHRAVTLSELGITNVDQLLQFAVGPSINNTVREGVVFKRADGQFSFKAISNVYLDEEE